MKNLVQELFDQTVNYGGFAMSRSSVLKHLKKITTDKQALELCFLGYKEITGKEARLLIPESRFKEIMKEDK